MIVIVVTVFGFLPSLAVGDYSLQLSCDGFAILNSPIAFSAFLNSSTESTDFLFLFEDNVTPSSVWAKRGASSANLTVVYTDIKPGNYTMKVAVSDYSKVVALNEISFTILDHIPVTLAFSQEGLLDKEVEFLLTNKEVYMRVYFHDPQNYFNNATILYTWEVGNYRISTPKQVLTFNFTHAGTYEVTATVIAKVMLLPNSLQKYGTPKLGYKWGFSRETVRVKEPITTFNVTGQTWLSHGQILDLNVFCTGSAPYVYCWKIFPHQENQYENLTCLEPIVTNNCSFPIIHYFPQSGSYRVGIHINNFVDFQWKDVKIFVYDVSHKPQLSVVILPVVCTILAVIIVTSGIIFYYQHRKKVYIEIADFDFLQSSNYMTEHSVWEQVFVAVKSKILYPSSVRNMFNSKENYVPIN